MCDYILDINDLIYNKYYRLVANCGYFVRDVQFISLRGNIAHFYDHVKKESHYISNCDIWRDDNSVKIQLLA